jgi:hypothetical protein
MLFSSRDQSVAEQSQTSNKVNIGICVWPIGTIYKHVDLILFFTLSVVSPRFVRSLLKRRLDWLFPYYLY